MSELPVGNIELAYERLCLVLQNKENMEKNNETTLEQLQTNNAKVTQMEASLQTARWATLNDHLLSNLKENATTENASQKTQIEELFTELQNISVTLEQSEQYVQQLKQQKDEIEKVSTELTKSLNDEIERLKCIHEEKAQSLNNIWNEQNNELSLQNTLNGEIQILSLKNQEQQRAIDLLQEQLNNKETSLKIVKETNKEHENAISGLLELIEQTEEGMKEQEVSSKLNENKIQQEIEELTVKLAERQKLNDELKNNLNNEKQKAEDLTEQINKTKELLTSFKLKESMQTQLNLVKNIMNEVDKHKEIIRIKQSLMLEQENKLKDLKETEVNLKVELAELETHIKETTRESNELNEQKLEIQSRIQTIDNEIELLSKSEPDVVQLMVNVETLTKTKNINEETLKKTKETVDMLNEKLSLAQKDFDEIKDVTKSYNVEETVEKIKDYDMRIQKYQVAVDRLKTRKLAAERRESLKQIKQILKPNE